MDKDTELKNLLVHKYCEVTGDPPPYSGDCPYSLEELIDLLFDKVYKHAFLTIYNQVEYLVNSEGRRT